MIKSVEKTIQKLKKDRANRLNAIGDLIEVYQEGWIPFDTKEEDEKYITHLARYIEFEIIKVLDPKRYNGIIKTKKEIKKQIKDIRKRDTITKIKKRN